MRDTNYMIEVMQAHEKGKAIEYRPVGSDDEWAATTDPTWNWTDLEYRVAPVRVSNEGFVGGVIFFVDNQSDEQVEFFDRNDNPIEMVSVGDRPYRYRIVKRGDRPRFWVYAATTSKPLRWEPNDSRDECIGTSIDFGSGMDNTEKALDVFDIGKKDQGTIWDFIKAMRDTKHLGCDDWFIPSKDEMDALRYFLEDQAADLDLTNIFDIAWLWTSSEYSATGSWIWDYGDQDMSYYYKSSLHCVVGVRAF